MLVGAFYRRHLIEKLAVRTVAFVEAIWKGLVRSTSTVMTTIVDTVVGIGSSKNTTEAVCYVVIDCTIAISTGVQIIRLPDVALVPDAAILRPQHFLIAQISAFSRLTSPKRPSTGSKMRRWASQHRDCNLKLLVGARLPDHLHDVTDPEHLLYREEDGGLICGEERVVRHFLCLHAAQA